MELHSTFPWLASSSELERQCFASSITKACRKANYTTKALLLGVEFLGGS